jgi:hypothetical protein
LAFSDLGVACSCGAVSSCLRMCKRAGQQPAGDRHGGDLGAATVGDPGLGTGERRASPGPLRGLLQHPPRPRGALLGAVAVADLATARCAPPASAPPRRTGCGPMGNGGCRRSRPAASLAAGPADPGQRHERRHARVRRASLLSCRSSRPVGVASVSMSRSSRPRSPAAPVGAPPPPMTPRLPGLGPQAAGRVPATVGGAPREPGSPRLVVRRTRPGPMARAGRAGHQRAAAGSCLRQQVSAQQLRQRLRVDLVVAATGRRRSPYSQRGGPGGPRASGRRAGRPANPSRRRPRTPPGAGRHNAKDGRQLGLVIREIAVALDGTGVIDDGDLGALAVDVHADVHAHCGPSSLRWLIPEA